MWIDEADGFVELLRGCLPYYLLVALPVFIIISPINPVAASHEFTAYRMQQYDLHTVPHGCRGAAVNLEGRSLTSWSTSRHCVVARMQDVSVDQFMEMKSKAGAILLIMPNNGTQLTDKQKENIQVLEMAMGQEEVTVPVYVVPWSPQLETIVEDLQHSFITDEKSGTALEAIINSASANGYQMVISSGAPQKIESKIVSLHGRLAGSGTSTQTIVIAAHYDAGGIAPELSFGADSNASGAVALLELARIFSKLYSSASTRGAPHLLFLLTGSGHTLNYYSAKKWLEDQLDGSENTLLQDVSFALSLDSVSAGRELTMHVSRPPKAGSAAASLQARLNAPYTHKKINLADEILAWPHERFSIRRMPAFTVSALPSHRHPGRGSLLDARSPQRAADLCANIRRVARALASHIYALTAEGDSDADATFYGDVDVDEAAVKSWYEYLASQPRSAQMISVTNGPAGVSAVLERVLARYLSDVTASVHAPDKREPEYTLYGPTRATLFVHNVKPAVFDLILTLAIAVYLTVLYFAIQLFPYFYEEFAKIVSGKVKVN